jgi:hypothetical protein
MQPRDTRYRLAHGRKDLQACHRLARAYGLDLQAFPWPTVVADRHGALVGCLATQPSRRAVIAGPLVVAGTRPLLTAVRLVDAYEGVLRLAGVTAYVFYIAHEDKAWRALVQRVMPSLHPYATTATEAWFIRRLA